MRGEVAERPNKTALVQCAADTKEHSGTEAVLETRGSWRSTGACLHQEYVQETLAIKRCLRALANQNGCCNQAHARPTESFRAWGVPAAVKTAGPSGAGRRSLQLRNKNIESRDKRPPGILPLHFLVILPSHLFLTP